MTAIFRPVDDAIDDDLDMKIKCDSQSLSFYSDIASFVSKHISGLHSLSLLDVGARTAAGTALLRAIHHPLSFARLKLHQVTALDLDAEALDRAAAEYPDLEYISRDVATLKGERSWDIVLSSHTIEHVDDPDLFVGNLEEVARRYIIVACPFQEEELIVGHSHRFNAQFFDKHGFDEIEIYRSQHWHGGMAVIAMKRLLSQ